MTGVSAVAQTVRARQVAREAAKTVGRWFVRIKPGLPGLLLLGVRVVVVDIDARASLRARGEIVPRLGRGRRRRRLRDRLLRLLRLRRRWRRRDSDCDAVRLR